GFIAALDQSGGSTPKALKQYGIDEGSFSTDDEMFALVHEMRTRIVTSPSFKGDKILGAILFEKTMDASMEDIPTARFLWDKLNIVPFLKIDKGLLDEKDGVQPMKPMPGLDDLLARAAAVGVFGTKMRSVINRASASGIAAIVDQQFEVAAEVTARGLVPIIEPEVNINAADKAACEDILRAELLKHARNLPDGHDVMLKLTLPDTANLYSELVAHENVLLVVALSGGYDLEEACRRLARNDGVVASFSRALSNGLHVSQCDDDFNAALRNAIDQIHAASVGTSAKA
ncbi:MAG: fructose bisphosphate aldolase, partial [Alphaproteobacteria bacterium]|nr:fructose bisphosphate aldolase [Alphaproteobacteria bacterium]